MRATETCILQTLCGCERKIVVEAGAMEYIVPLFESFLLKPHDTSDDELSRYTNKQRMFVYRGIQKTELTIDPDGLPKTKYYRILEEKDS